MKLRRLYQIIRLWTIPSDSGRAEWAKKHHIYAGVGEKVRIMDKKIPLYANLIRFHNNIQVASNVSFITHDAIMSVYNSDYQLVSRGGVKVQEHIGCIEIMDNVFIGSGSIILGGVRIGPNAIVAAGSMVNKDVPEGSIVGGCPAKVIGNYHELLEKRRIDEYPREIKPRGQAVSEELANYMWNQFYEKRNKHTEK